MYLWETTRIYTLMIMSIKQIAVPSVTIIVDVLDPPSPKRTRWNQRSPSPEYTPVKYDTVDEFHKVYSYDQPFTLHLGPYEHMANVEAFVSDILIPPCCEREWMRSDLLVYDEGDERKWKFWLEPLYANMRKTPTHYGTAILFPPSQEMIKVSTESSEVSINSDVWTLIVIPTGIAFTLVAKYVLITDINVPVWLHACITALANPIFTNIPMEIDTTKEQEELSRLIKKKQRKLDTLLNKLKSLETHAPLEILKPIFEETKVSGVCLTTFYKSPTPSNLVGIDALVYKQLHERRRPMVLMNMKKAIHGHYEVIYSAFESEVEPAGYALLGSTWFGNTAVVELQTQSGEEFYSASNFEVWNVTMLLVLPV